MCFKARILEIYISYFMVIGYNSYEGIFYQAEGWCLRFHTKFQMDVEIGVDRRSRHDSWQTFVV